MSTDETLTSSETAIPDFNVEAEYVPDPLIPDGIYNAIIVDIKYNNEMCSLQWELALQNNPGIMCDNGVTPVDGRKVFLSNWLPIPGDEAKVGKRGISTRASKISMMKRFGNDMRISFNTPSDIQDILTSRNLIASTVIITLKNRTYEGKLYTDVKKMERVG